MYIIAEIGSNWRDFDDACQSIGMAAACGADAVKFQHFTFEELYGVPATEFSPNRNGGIKAEWLPQLKEKADACNVDFMCTAFSREGVDRVDPYVKGHKVAGSEASWIDFVQYVASKKKPTFVTCGHLGIKMQNVVYQALRCHLHPEMICLMYGEPEYPCRGYNMDLLELMWSQVQDHKVKFGLSDHTREMVSTAQAAEMKLMTDEGESKVTVLEKHVQFVPGHFPDTDVSLDKDEFARMCKILKQDAYAVAANRHDYATRYNRRLIAKQPIRPGELFTDANHGAYRSLESDTRAINCNVNIAGKRCLKDLAPGQPITPQDVEL